MADSRRCAMLLNAQVVGSLAAKPRLTPYPAMLTAPDLDLDPDLHAQLPIIWFRL